MMWIGQQGHKHHVEAVSGVQGVYKVGILCKRAGREGLMHINEEAGFAAFAHASTGLLSVAFTWRLLVEAGNRK